MSFEQILIYIGIPLIGFLLGITANILRGTIKDLCEAVKNLDDKAQKESLRLDEKREESMRRVHARMDTIAKDLHDTEITVAGFPGTFISRNECDKRHTGHSGD